MKIGFLGALQLLFIGLKLARQIDWGWGYVLIPVWIWLALLSLIGLLAVGIAAIEQAEKRKLRRP